MAAEDELESLKSLFWAQKRPFRLDRTDDMKPVTRKLGVTRKFARSHLYVSSPSVQAWRSASTGILWFSVRIPRSVQAWGGSLIVGAVFTWDRLGSTGSTMSMTPC
ncbi:hypothetical protein TNCV_334751 [Trichonephila clavipes]|nr:hypothetical protein TNCV_334751 [Trichonephila clavipes]